MGKRSCQVARIITSATLITLGVVASVYAQQQGSAKTNVQVTVAAVQYEGTKLWIPGTIVVNKGDRVEVKLINKIPAGPAQHGWAIDAFKVAKLVNRGEPTSVEFVADKTGIFPIYCQLHPTHIGGQLIVLDAD